MLASRVDIRPHIVELAEVAREIDVRFVSQACAATGNDAVLESHQRSRTVTCEGRRMEAHLIADLPDLSVDVWGDGLAPVYTS